MLAREGTSVRATAALQTTIDHGQRELRRHPCLFHALGTLTGKSKLAARLSNVLNKVPRRAMNSTASTFFSPLIRA